MGKIDTTCPVCTADLTACLGEEPEPEAPEELEEPQPAPEAEEPEDDSSSAVAAVILLLVVLAGGVAFVVKMLRRKGKAPSRPPEDDDEAYVVENVETHRRRTITYGGVCLPPPFPKNKRLKTDWRNAYAFDRN